MRVRLRRWLERARNAAATPAGKRCAALARLGVVALVIAFLVLRLNAVGWRETLNALPGSPWFYILFLGFYFSLPLFETAIYRRLWGLPWRALPLFVRKRVLNEAFVEYSGDAYLFGWARNRIGRENSEILHTVKDVAILSSIAGHLVTVAALLLLVASGHLPALIAANPEAAPYLLAPGVIVAVVVVGLYSVRDRLFRMPADVATTTLGLHLARQVSTLGFQVGMWAVALPTAGWSAWLVLLAARTALSRVPLLPNKELMFAGLGVALSGVIAAPPERIAAMFVASGALVVGCHLLVFVLGLRGASRAVSPTA